MVELTGCGPVLTEEGNVNDDVVPSGSNACTVPEESVTGLKLS